jgi:catechol 2,3-dioxygenase-like lactoylglutathione lyase family enzyme
MANRFTPDILLQTEDIAAAAAFYVDTLGFEITDETPDLVSLHGPSINLFIHRGPSLPGPVLEVVVDDAADARARLTQAGCEVVRDDEVHEVRRCYVKDRYGLIYNLAE